MIAAAYIALTLLSQALGLASGPVQLRLSEALCALPLLTGAAVPGLFVGCFLANWLCGCALWDVVVGSLATLMGAWGAYKLRKRPLLSLLMPILSNVLCIPPVLLYVYGAPMGLGAAALLVGAGELISAGVLGYLLYRGLLPHAAMLFHERRN